MKVTIIIPVWNRKEDLKNVLESLKKQSYKDFEIIVVDDNSTDGTIELVENEYKYVKLIKNKENMGPAYARNKGIINSNGKYIWFLDSDSIVVNEGCLKKLVYICEKRKNIGCIGGCYNKKGFINIIKKGRGNYLPISSKPILVKCDFVETANCFIKKKLLEQIGGFDPNYSLLEDTDLCFKIIKRGYSIVIDYRITVLHNVSEKQRISSFNLTNKNLIRFMLLNYNLALLPFLPIFNLLYVVRSYKRFKKMNVEEITNLSEETREELAGNSIFLKITKIGMIYISSLLEAYFWNLKNLPKTLYLRFKKPSYLNEIYNE